MDGNGRWAAARGLPRGEGHRRGVEALRRTVRAAGEIGIRYLTIFSFSAGELVAARRPKSRDLMGLLRRFIRNDLAELHQSNVRVRIIGERDGLDPDIRAAAGGGRGADQGQRRPDAGGRVQLRRAPGDRARRARASPSAVATASSSPPTITAELFGAASRRARHARPRSHHPHQRRAAAVEFPAVAGGLQRAGVRADLLAGLRPRRARSRDRRISPARAPLRRAGRARPGPELVAGNRADPRQSRHGRARAAAAISRLRIVSALVLAPLALAAAYFGGWPFALFWTLAARRRAVGMDHAGRRRRRIR